MHNPEEQHMNAVMRILRYLKSAPGKGILFTKNVDCQSVDAYSDVDWARAIDDRRSTSGYFTFVGGNQGRPCGAGGLRRHSKRGPIVYKFFFYL